MITAKYDLETIAYSVTGWNGIITTDIEKIEAHLHSRLLGTLGETVAEFKAVYMTSAGTYFLAQADSTKQPAIGLTIESGIASDEIRIQRSGPITDPSWTWTPGAKIYLDPATPGELTQTKPDQNAQILGLAISATIVFLTQIIEIPKDLILSSLKMQTSTDSFGTATVADESTTQADPDALTSSDIAATDANTVAATDADTVTAADADATYGAEEQGLINELKADYNAAATLINELKTDYNAAVTLINELKTDCNLLRADVENIRSVLIGTIDYNDALKNKINGLLTELRKTNGCGVLDG